MADDLGEDILADDLTKLQADEVLIAPDDFGRNFEKPCGQVRAI